MTQNQINYWNYRETGRHNLATEGETNRHNVVTENETQRHNMVGERETERHNRATEGIDLSKLAETQRHNRASESLAGRGYDIEEYKARELARHNQAQEGLTGVDLSIRQQSLGETVRHNMAQESLTGYDLNIKSGQLEETGRHNVATEQISKYQAVSQNQVNESLTALNEVKATWEQLNQSKNVQLSDAKIRQIDAGISKMQKEMDLLESQKTQTDLNNFWHTYNEIWSAVEALIPG